MSKQFAKFGIVGLSILSLAITVTMLSGCGQDRPGVRYGADAPTDPDNRDWNSPEMFEKKMAHLIGLVKGQDARKARRAAQTLGKMGKTAESALDDLKEFKDHPVEETRLAIVEAIEKIERSMAGEDINAGSTEEN